MSPCRSSASSPAPRPLPAAPEAALGAAELAARLAGLGPFERRPRLAVAVSGGPDSMALALLLAEWAVACQGSLLALIVDHRLRDGSTGEAAATAARLASHGIPARILAWDGPKPAAGIQAAARDARYRLLADACREAGILHLFLAHHLDDQAETVALRRARGSGPMGLAGMAPIREIHGLRLLRPLLDLPKTRLVATLVARGQDWIEDPANSSPRFARSALRADPALDRGALAASARAHAEARAAREQRLARMLAATVQAHPLGFVRLDPDPLGDLLPLALERMLLAVSGRTLPPRTARLARLVDGLGAERLAATLHGCLVQKRGAVLTILREPEAAAGRQTIRPGERQLWDGRFRVRLLEGPGALELGRLDRTTVAGRPAGVPAAAIRSLPALWMDGRPVWSPLGGQEDGIVADARWMPALPLAGAAFARSNIV